MALPRRRDPREPSGNHLKVPLSKASRSVAAVRAYFSGLSGARAVVWWVVAARGALDRWEPLVAAHVRDVLAGVKGGPRPDTWAAQREHHYALLSTRHVLRAVALLDPPLLVDAELVEEIISGRDLLEHWDENQPIFNVTPRPKEPARRSGKGFAERNPGRSPYWGTGWSSKQGPLLLPRVPASAVHTLLDSALEQGLAEAPDLGPYVLERPPSAWLEQPEINGYWPRPVD